MHPSPLPVQEKAGDCLLISVELKAVNENTGTEYQQSKILDDQIDYQFALGESFSGILFAT